MNKVLLIVDMQKGFINKKIYSDLVVKIDDLIKKTLTIVTFLQNLLTKTIVFLLINWIGKI